MHAVQQQPTGPNLFRPSLLAWRAKYLASRTVGDGTEAGTSAVRYRVLKARPRKLAAGR